MFPVCVPVKKRSRGFTLIELLVVVFIISILIAATLTIIPKVKRAVYGAQTSAQLATIATAIQQYYADFKAYPGPLANSQLYTFADSSTAPAIVGKNDVNTATDTNSVSGIYLDASGSSGGTALDPTHITSSENLVLGLCGGLRYNQTTNTVEYHPGDLISATLTGGTPPTSSIPVPLAKGPPSLNPSSPRKQQSYLTVNPGDLSIPNNKINKGEFTDSANRFAADSLIPEFVDKYSEPLPILYFRTNTGGTAIAGFRNCSTPGGTQLSDPGAPTTYLIAQYDLDQNMAYTGCPAASVVSVIGTAGNTTGNPTSNPNSVHGLQGLGNTALTDPLDTNLNGTYVPAGPSSSGFTPGANGLAYFKDPSLNTATSTNTSQGVARQKDGFILISAGPDRQYGTRDDVIYPGPLLP